MDDEYEDIEDMGEMTLEDLLDSGNSNTLLKDKEIEQKFKIDLDKLSEELDEMGAEEGEEFEFIIEVEDYEGMYGSQLIEYLLDLEDEEIIEKGDSFQILSLSIEWPVDILLEDSIIHY